MTGHRIYSQDKIGDLTKLNSTTIQLAASSVTLGGLQYDTANLQILTASNGVGGLDVGFVEANIKYYIYAVLNGSSVALVASKSDLAPTGFSIFNRIGFFVTDYAAAITSINEGNRKTYWEKRVQSADISTTTTLVSTDLSFSNLEVGKTYKLTGCILWLKSAAGSGTSGSLKIRGAAPSEELMFTRNDGNELVIKYGVSTVFTTTSSGTLIVEMRGHPAGGQTLRALSFLVLEELPQHEETSQWI